MLKISFLETEEILNNAPMHHVSNERMGYKIVEQ